MRRKLAKISKYRPSVFQAKMDFSAVKEGFSLTAEHPMERTVFRTFGIILFVLLCSYFYFVSASVLNIIARKEADTKSASLQTSVAQMEQRYFALRDSVTPQEATSLGLSRVKDMQYVYVPGNAASAGTVAIDAI